MTSHMDTYALKAVTDLPAPFRSAFNFRYFNSLQSECFPTCYLSDINMVISAPTGSGKTVLFELCIMRLLSKSITADGKFTHHIGTLKTIYIAPSKALVQEKLRHWSQKLGTFGINCLELTGDNEYYSVKSMQDADIILTTPEKFNAVTRCRIKDGGLSFFSDISLVLIDEVHLLNDPEGAALEAIVSRIKMLACNPEMKSSPLSLVRFLGVSATIPNINDLGSLQDSLPQIGLHYEISNMGDDKKFTFAVEWLMVPTQGIKKFGEEMRPVKLTTKVFGYTPAKNEFLFEKRLQNYIFDLLMQFSGGKSALIFCSTRKGAQEAAQCLYQLAKTLGHSSPFIKSREQQEILREASLSCSDKQMRSYILYGVGYYNGGLSMKDRNLMEGLFLNGNLQILCTTNTLALGINLPAHTVVIKSTQYFNKEKGMYMEYERSMILQMCGRAGRPPFDDTGMVIIMTRKETVHLYENLLGGCEMVESQLLPCVTEHLIAEIVESTVSDITRAIEWMKCSYLYVRMKKNPENYSIKGMAGNLIEKHLQEICVQKVNELSKYQMVWTDDEGFLLKPLEPGRLMTKYYLKFDTMKHIIQAPTNCSIDETLRTICKSEEIAWIQLRRNEKNVLNDINNDKDGRLRFHILDDRQKCKKCIQSREEKIFILVNDCLTGDPVVRDLSMTQDTNSICSNGSRIAKCMKEYFMYKKSYKGALNSILLAKCLQQKLWDDSPYLLKQLPGIGIVTAKALHSMGVTSFDTLSEADPRKIELATGRKYPFGNHIKESLLSLPPKIEMTVKEPEVQRIGKSKLQIMLTRLSESVPSTQRHYADVIVGVEEDNLILFYEKIRLEDFSSPYHATVLFSCPEQGKLTIKADLMFEEFIGIDLHQKVIVTPPADSNAIPKFRQRELSSFIPKDVHNIKDFNNRPSLPASHELIEMSTFKFFMNSPNFKLIDKESKDDNPVAEEKADMTDIEVIEFEGDEGCVGEETVRAARMTDKEVVEIEGDEGGVSAGATDGGCEGRRGRKRRQLPPSLEANEKVDGVKGKEKVDGGCAPPSSSKVKKRSWLLVNLGLLKTTLADTSGCDEDVDFLETAKRNGMIFPRPRWWPPADDKEVIEFEGDEGGVGAGATDGGCEGRRGRKRRQVPPSLEAKEKVDGVKGKEKVDGGCTPPLPPSSLKVKKRSWLLDNLGLLKTTLADTSGCDEDVDFVETAKRNGMIFPRPRWWPPAADGSFY